MILSNSFLTGALAAPKTSKAFPDLDESESSEVEGAVGGTSCLDHGDINHQHHQSL